MAKGGRIIRVEKVELNIVQSLENSSGWLGWGLVGVGLVGVRTPDMMETELGGTLQVPGSLFKSYSISWESITSQD